MYNANDFIKYTPGNFSSPSHLLYGIKIYTVGISLIFHFSFFTGSDSEVCADILESFPPLPGMEGVELEIHEAPILLRYHSGYQYRSLHAPASCPCSLRSQIKQIARHLFHFKSQFDPNALFLSHFESKFEQMALSETFSL